MRLNKYKSFNKGDSIIHTLPEILIKKQSGKLARRMRFFAYFFLKKVREKYCYYKIFGSQSSFGIIIQFIYLI
jgi:hypothetical protein